MPGEVEHIIRRLGGWRISEVPPDRLVPVVAGIVTEWPQLAGEIIDTSFEATRALVLTNLIAQRQLPFAQADIAFAEALVNEPLVPFEESPLKALSMAEIAKAGGVATGAYVGFMVAGSTSLLLITVPAGMILCGAAAGIGEGLRRRFGYCPSSVLIGPKLRYVKMP